MERKLIGDFRFLRFLLPHWSSGSVAIVLLLGFTVACHHSVSTASGRVVSCEDDGFRIRVTVLKDEGQLTRYDSTEHSVPGCGTYSKGGRFLFTLSDEDIITVRLLPDAPNSRSAQEPPKQ